MVSKIIQKEKERQEEYIKFQDNEYSLLHSKEEKFALYGDESQLKHSIHKQSLINLKEYMEEELRLAEGAKSYDETEYAVSRVDQLKEDIAELTKMIERYE